MSVSKKSSLRWRGQNVAMHIDTSASGFVVNRSVNPTKWEDSNLGAMAACYSLYRPKSMKLTWTPSCSATTPGSIVYGVSYGSNLSKNSGLVAMQQLLSTDGSRLVSINGTHTWTVPFHNLPQKWFYVDADHDIDSEPCRIMAMLVDTEKPATAYGLGILVISYDYEFSEPVASQTICKELNYAGNSKATTGVNQTLLVSLGDEYDYTSIIFNDVAAALGEVITPGVRYTLGKVVGSATDWFLSFLGVPVLCPSSTIASAVSGMLEYKKEQVADPISLTLANVYRDAEDLKFTPLNVQEPSPNAQLSRGPTGIPLSKRV